MEINTILVLLIIGHVIMLILTFASYTQSRNYLIKLSSTAQLLYCISYCTLFTLNTFPMPLVIVVSTSTLIAAMTIQCVCILISIDCWKPSYRKYYILSLSIPMLFVYVCIIMNISEAMRTVITSLMVAGLIVPPTYCLLRYHENSSIRKIIGYTYLASLPLFLIRIASAIQVKGDLVFFTQNITYVLALVVLYIFMTVHGIGFLLLLREADEKMLRQLATVDQLTQVMNRAALIENCQRLIEQHHRTHQSLGIMMIDIDHFKYVNDTKGHAHGDRVLQEFSQVIRSQLRSYDILGRYGGEEFIVLIPSTEEAGAISIADRIRSEIQSQTEVTVSIGLYVLIPESDDSFFSMFMVADQALYQAKENGRNQYCLGNDIHHPNRIE